MKLLLLCKDLVLGGGSGIVTFIFAHKGGQHIHYESMSMNSHWIMQVGRLKMNYIPLMFH